MHNSVMTGGPVILTEWTFLIELIPEYIKAHMAAARIVDGRNIFDPPALRAKGFSDMRVGR